MEILGMGFIWLVSQPGELPPRLLSEPCVKVSPHTAPTIQSGSDSQFPVDK